MKLIFALLLTTLNLYAQQSVVVISVDGLDSRYLEGCDRLGLKIPNLRRLMSEGQWAKGVTGVVPTATWPSHTTIITGVDPTIHGILGNRRPKDEGGDYYWSANLLKARTLLDAASQAGKKTAAVTWPVTVDAPVTYNLPEYFVKRRGGAMDLPSIASKETPPGLSERIGQAYPSFPQEWMDDRTRTLATLYLLKTHRPDLTLVHMVDLDSEAHDNGPFSREANAILEYTDEMLGRVMAELPAGYILVVMSDHGFERVERDVNLLVLAKAAGVAGIRPMGGIAVAQTGEAADFLRKLRTEAKHGVGREIPKEEIARFAPRLAGETAVFEPAEGFWFGTAASGEEFSKPREIGTHGHWPTRYRPVFLAWGKGLAPARTPEISLKDVAGRIAAFLGIPFQPGPRN